MGFAWRYLTSDAAIPFDQELTKQCDNGDSTKVEEYRDKYLDCQGNINDLSSQLASDIYLLWNNPVPQINIKNALRNGAISFGIISQATTANVFGDINTERKLRAVLTT